MRKPKIFLGSSSEAKNLGYTQLVAEVISSLSAEPLPWWRSEVFPEGVGFLEALTSVTGIVSAALLIATPDDQTIVRGRAQLTPRDNVLLEYGLFTGALGRNRVALILIGKSLLPSDLDGVTQIQVQPFLNRTGEEYKDTELIPKLRSWIERLILSQRDVSPELEIRDLVREIGPERTALLLGEARYLKLGVTPLARYPITDIEKILRSCTLPGNESVGIGTRVPLTHYIQVANLPPDSSELSVLVCALCNNIAEACDASRIRPTRVAVLKTGPIEFGRRVAELFGFPVVYVTPIGPNSALLVDGVLGPADHVIIAHDVIVTGDTLVRCANVIRSRKASVAHVFTLVHYTHPTCDARELLSLNNLALHCVTTVSPEWFLSR